VRELAASASAPLHYRPPLGGLKSLTSSSTGATSTPGDAGAGFMGLLLDSSLSQDLRPAVRNDHAAEVDAGLATAAMILRGIFWSNHSVDFDYSQRIPNE
jgi:hypothetical protein